MVEHRSEKPGVASSILAPATTLSPFARSFALAASVLTLAVLGWTQAPVAAVVRPASSVEFKASGSLPPGAEYHLVYENPKTHAVQTLVRMPKGYSLPPHSHSADETILVLRGKLVLELGGEAKTLTSGGYAVLPAGTVFALKTAGFGEVEFLAAFAGPYDVLPAPAPAAR